MNRTIGSTLNVRRLAASAKLAGAAVCLAACLAGCVTRRMTVRTNVPGAQVYVDNFEVGRTPASTDFTYYGTRNIRVVKDGFETLTVQQPVAAPWYQIPGIDFLAENVWPFEIRDERQYSYNLQPQYVVPTDALVGRAEELRRANAQTAVVAPVAQNDLINAPPGGLQALPPGSAVYGQPTTPAPVLGPGTSVPVNPYGPTSSFAPGMVAPPLDDAALLEPRRLHPAGHHAAGQPGIRPLSADGRAAARHGQHADRAAAVSRVLCGAGYCQCSGRTKSRT